MVIFMMDQISGGAVAISMDQTPRPMLIGERLNAKGSKKAEKLMIEKNYNGLLTLARKQISEGAHALDINADSNEIPDEANVMKDLISTLNYDAGVPLIIDSNDPKLLEVGARFAAGRAMLNSINLETTERFDRVAKIMSKYGMPSIALCIGKDGMAKTTVDKLKVAKDIIEQGKKYNLAEEMFVIDALAFPIAAGEPESAIETLEAIKLIKVKFPKSRTSLGISNVSMTFKPPARKRINSVFLYHAVKAGLDMAIVNVAEILPYNSIPQEEKTIIEDMLFNRRPDEDLPLIVQKHFQDVKDQNSDVDIIDPNWDPGKKIYEQIVRQVVDGIDKNTQQVIKDEGGNHEGALGVLDKYLLPAMQKVGDLFGSGDLLLSSVLTSAKAMKMATKEVEKYLDKKEDVSKGTLVVGTVWGDVHDIGKNLAKTIIENNGWNVVDLGVRITRDEFLKAVKEHDAVAVGLSALLVNSSKEMVSFIDYARENKLDLPILCGGAAINSNFINRACKRDEIYDKAFYCRDMFDGLNLLEDLKKDRKAVVKKRRVYLKSWVEKTYMRTQKESTIVALDNPPIPDVELNKTFLGTVNIWEAWKYLDIKELFGVNWGIKGRNVKQEREEHKQILRDLQKETAHLFEPSFAWGFFKCSSDKELLNINGEKFQFPRSINGPCLADYFGKDDIVALQAVTVGEKIKEYAAKLNEQDDYARSNYVSGLGAQSAEAVASYVNEALVNKAWNLTKSKRYSWGYLACPDHMQHFNVWKLLKPSNMTLLESGEIVPEYSTAAIVVHHPEAIYFQM